MKIAEDEARGLMAVALDDGDENVLRYGRMKYDGNRRQYTPDCGLALSNFAAWPTKKEASDAAKRLGFPVTHVERIGSRFWSCWGIRHDFRDSYFLATYE